MEGKTYKVGLFHDMQLMIVNNDNLCYIRVDSGDKIKVVCNKNDYSMKLYFMVDNDSFCEIDRGEVEKKVIMQTMENGSRWEGDLFNQFPFGFGSIYDGEGNRIYSGFMFEGKKIGFGEEYFADNHKVDYCGNFMNDKRHGWGTTYDRNGNKLYEGDWRFGKNAFDERIVIKNEKDCLRIHDLIKELEIGEKCLNDWKYDLIIQNYPNLQSIVVKKNSSQNLNLLKICNCEKLKNIEIESNDFHNVKNVIIEST